jgi:cytochrome c biogenesis protein CcmG, thiol:disulfide interchange protein DsbE
MRKVWPLALLFLLGLAQAVGPGERIPDFALLDPAGKPITRDTMKKPAVIVFWASWCPVCRAEFPGLHKVAEETKVPFYVISREPKDTKEVVLTYMKAYPASSPFWPRPRISPTRWRPALRCWASPGPLWWTRRPGWWPSSPGGRGGRPF